MELRPHWPIKPFQGTRENNPCIGISLTIVLNSHEDHQRHILMLEYLLITVGAFIGGIVSTIGGGVALLLIPVVMELEVVRSSKNTMDAFPKLAHKERRQILVVSCRIDNWLIYCGGAIFCKKAM